MFLIVGPYFWCNCATTSWVGQAVRVKSGECFYFGTLHAVINAVENQNPGLVANQGNNRSNHSGIVQTGTVASVTEFARGAYQGAQQFVDCFLAAQTDAVGAQSGQRIGSGQHFREGQHSGQCGRTHPVLVSVRKKFWDLFSARRAGPRGRMCGHLAVGHRGRVAKGLLMGKVIGFIARFPLDITAQTGNLLFWHGLSGKQRFCGRT